MSGKDVSGKKEKEFRKGGRRKALKLKTLKKQKTKTEEKTRKIVVDHRECKILWGGGSKSSIWGLSFP